jgi:hypothetical protein
MKQVLLCLSLATAACVTEPAKPVPPLQIDDEPDAGLVSGDPEFLAEPPPTTGDTTSCHLRQKIGDCLP